MIKTNEILEYMKNKPLGTGTEATTYDADKFVLRIPKALNNKKLLQQKISQNSYKWEKAVNEHGSRNFGQTIYTLTDKTSLKPVLYLCKKADGIATNDLVEEPLTPKQITKAQKTAIEKMKIIASAPMNSFRRLIDDFNHLTHTNFTIDPSEGNLLINPKTKRFYIIDLRPIKKIRNLGDLILLLLTDIPNTPDNKEYFDLETKIITKLINAANKQGLVHPEQLQFKSRAMEVIKSKTAQDIYKNNYDKIKLV